MSRTDAGFPEEIVGLTYHFLPPERQAEVSRVLSALQEDAHLEFMLAVLAVTVNDRRLSPAVRPSRVLLGKLLQALREADGATLLYASPYNELGEGFSLEFEPRLEPWNFDLADRLYEFRELHSVRAFLEHGTGTRGARSPEAAQALHDALLRGLVGADRGAGIWGCTLIRVPGAPAERRPPAGEGLWPAADVSEWFRGVFWDDLLLLLSPEESTLSLLAITSF